MTNPIPITTVITGILAIAQVPLTVLVSYLRGKTGIQFLDGGNQTLLRRIRAHGNFVETVPITLLAMAGAQQGLRRSWPLIPAEALGYVLAISVWGWLLSHLLDQLPWAVRVLRLLCALYLIRVALRLWRSRPTASVWSSRRLRP